jgi:hypothetical protein
MLLGMFGLLGRFVWCWIVAGGGRMANIKIPAWDVAEALGLEYFGEEYDEYKCYYIRKFKFHSKEIIDDGWRENDEDAKEAVAEGLLRDIGKKLSEMI